MFGRRVLLAGAAVAPFGLRRARAQVRPIRLGVLGDFSGPYRHLSGPTAVACVKQAVEDSGILQKGIAVEVIQADHQQKADAGLATAREWFDRGGVDVVLEVNNSSIALALNALVREKDKIHLNTGAATSELTAKACSPNTIQWTYDTYMLARSSGVATVQAGAGTFFIIAADMAFGHQMERDVTRFVEAGGGKVVGSLRHPFPGTTDFSSMLVQAQRSRAKVVAFANAGTDFINCVKQAHEFGLVARGQKLLGTIAFVNDVKSLGLETTKGLLLTESFYWDLNDRTRAFTKRVLPKTPDNYPNQTHAGNYSAVIHYLKAVSEVGAARAKASGREVIEVMRRMPTDDDAFGAGSIRVDGRHLHDVHLFEAKAPAESTHPWDLLKLVRTTPAAEAFRPLSEGGCSLA
ncbi:ABC transporter substrate-binding protein [Pseudoroseomonas ludipueritiae]|uniref:ABC transporter substrate-binding protein n=1 Tax=Pseudoroseomonas ludipueritiae TaxID=198093 RepID=A0ABR7R4J2_9PROT|nr:ABC transporter substrate-binding protein [Pseudoroseomonas ludipueritiae]MBC9176578.1 ABC transporter substrate-binding protein [Pseudoroseomonas ludipueritiae]